MNRSIALLRDGWNWLRENRELPDTDRLGGEGAGFQFHWEQHKRKTEVLPGCLTFPPLAVSLVPKDNIRKPSFLIEIAAFTSLSRFVLHLEQVQFLILRGKLSILLRQI
jgi:hypothetical protein